MMRRVRLAVLAGIIVAVLLELAAVSQPGVIDFTAFYCAGQVIRDHGDPYKAYPLGTCEARLGSGGIFHVRGVVMPAPLPPYALAPFAALADLPYERALVAWRLLLILAIVTTIEALRRVAKLPWPAVALALLMTDVVAGILPGQPVPLVVAAIAVGAWALKRGADRLAGAVACITMFEPHIGIPVCLTLFCSRPAARVTITCGAITAAALSLAVAPMSVSLEYIARVLPEHAAAEIPWFGQYSVTHALYVFGANDHLSLTVGFLSYVVMLTFAVMVAPRVAMRLGLPSLLMALPAAVVVFGGSYVHLPQMAVAVPAALILAGRAYGLASRLGAAAAVLLTVPGILFGATGVTFIAAGIAALLTILLFRPLPAVSALVAAMVLAVGMALHGLHPIAAEADHEFVAAPASAGALAEDTWSHFVRAEDPGMPEHRLELLAAAPTWAGLGLLCGAAALSAFAGVRGKEKAEAALPDPCRG